MSVTGCIGTLIYTSEMYIAVNMKPIDLWDIRTFDYEVIKFLKERADLIRDS